MDIITEVNNKRSEYINKRGYVPTILLLSSKSHELLKKATIYQMGLMGNVQNIVSMTKFMDMVVFCVTNHKISTTTLFVEVAS